MPREWQARLCSNVWGPKAECWGYPTPVTDIYLFLWANLFKVNLLVTFNAVFLFFENCVHARQYIFILCPPSLLLSLLGPLSRSHPLPLPFFKIT